ncbi:hypothetical protein DID76_01435 [Candidatus Marinamargulisbacteria bacterium SCGC AG-414-C22]|nr:hypothetical protein DID76_01435 [Candidatus Marinamargulisbacteria bacterium SCGC AG-414-C22]
MIHTEKISDSILMFHTDNRHFGLEFGNRMTVIKCHDDSLFVHSPIILDDHALTELNNFGTVTYIIAPNLLHHLYLDAFVKLFPNAKVFGVHGLQKKVKNISFSYLEDETEGFGWDNDIDTYKLHGMPLFNEHIFYHKATQTLLVTDLLFNIQNKKGFSKFMFKLYGVYNKLGTTILFKSMIFNKPKFRKVIETIRQLPINHIVLSHGHNILENASEKLRKALAWV